MFSCLNFYHRWSLGRQGPQGVFMAYWWFVSYANWNKLNELPCSLEPIQGSCLYLWPGVSFPPHPEAAQPPGRRSGCPSWWGGPVRTCVAWDNARPSLEDTLPQTDLFPENFHVALEKKKKEKKEKKSCIFCLLVCKNLPQGNLFEMLF